MSVYLNKKVVAGSVNVADNGHNTVISGKNELYGCLINAYYEIVDELKELLVAVELDSGDVAGGSGFGLLHIATA